MEQIMNNRLVCTGMENPDGTTDVKARSGLLISKAPSYEPVKITRLKNEKVIGHNGVRTNVGVKPALNRTVRCEGPMIIEDEETRKLFTDSNGVVHSVVFTDPVTGERRFG